MTILWDQIGIRIRDRRKAIGLTQAALAEAVGVKWQAIARVETGARRPSLELLERLADLFECRVGDLLPERKPRAKRSRSTK